MIKKFFVIFIIILLCILPLGASFSYADSTLNGVFDSSRYLTISFHSINRIVNTDNYYTSFSYMFGLEFSYEFSNRRFYPSFYIDGVLDSSIYIQDINSYSSERIENGYTNLTQGLITEFPPTIIPNLNDGNGVYSDRYNATYFYFYNDCVVSDTSFIQVNITVGDVSIIPATVRNQNPRIYYSDTNYFSIFGATYQSFASYKLFDFVTENSHHFYIVVPVSDSQFYSTTYYFVPPSSDYTTGYNAGYNEGYNAGISNTAVATYNGAYETGYNAGFAVGRSTGYNEAIESGAGDNTFVGLISAVIDVPLNVLKGLFDFNILGINLLQFFYSIFTVLLLIFVIKTLIR